MQSRKALIEVAKVMQKIANMACMTDADMEASDRLATIVLTDKVFTGVLEIRHDLAQEENCDYSSVSICHFARRDWIC